jgi:hypothetical protein
MCARPQLSRDPLGGGEDLKRRLLAADLLDVRYIKGLLRTDHFQPAGRVLELLAGIVCAACGAGLAVLGGFGLFATLMRNGSPPGLSPFVFALVVSALAALFLVLAWRLVLNRGRLSDGGLFSPFGLRAGGFIFLAGPVAAAFTHPIGLIETGFALAASGACFALARHREHYLSGLVPPAA